MKQLKVKEYSVKDQVGHNMSTQGMIKHCLLQSSPQGFGIEEVRARIRIEDAMKEANESIALEDADAKNLKDIVNKATWGTYHEDIIDFVDAINGMK